MKIATAYFSKKNYRPFPFQEETWNAMEKGLSGLVSIATGSGKTYAVYFGALEKAIHEPYEGLQILYISPLRSLTRDVEKALMDPIKTLSLPLTIESRTSDTASKIKSKQLRVLPNILITTPESLSLLLSHDSDSFKGLQTIIIDEWHELLGTKRGVLLELSLAHLRRVSPKVSTWAISATIGNLEEAAQIAVGAKNPYSLISKNVARALECQIILPDELKEMPLTGRYGLRLFPYVIPYLDPESTTIIFVNTRAQAESWFRAISEFEKGWKKITALHHSALDREVREEVETKAKSGDLSFIIATSSLDLGIDFPSVDKVIQIGSPKSVSRLLQRAGRSRHRPNEPSHILLLPTHALEVIEIKSLIQAVTKNKIEKREPLTQNFDVLVQHLTTLALGSGLDPHLGFEEALSTHAFKDLTKEEFEECLDFLIRGGKSLKAYPDYKKIHLENGLLKVKEKQIATRHRLSIGTIQSEASASVRMVKGKNVGSLEESFISQLAPGEHFSLGGVAYQLIRYKDLVATVRLSKNPKLIHTPIWGGGLLPFSKTAASELKLVLDDFATKKSRDDSITTKILEWQEKISTVPKKEEFLVEEIKTRDGWHLFFYPLLGRKTHEALALLFSYRLTHLFETTLSFAANDFGFEILSSKKLEIDEKKIKELCSLDSALLDLEKSVHLSEIAKVKFREIARISGLVFTGYPGGFSKSLRQLQASSSLLFDVFTKYDPEQFLLKQAYFEAKLEKLGLDDFLEDLKSINELTIKHIELKKLSLFSLPLYAELDLGRLSSEDIFKRIETIRKGWRKSA
ncbi:ligase-associated DNA damage response DEXH box helicase [Criblamydia sequanensis]|uniref:ATP-dependent helicase n=1 Tax=Candidatus Criblamydia sequanensis CRIB-18 TaxID=1437425 RepID=A0A090D0F3_9BACT|nr:ligase-associated DNA damage response DEXH box helicase [Criblamydia sequanensis]CDR35017.1 ATP-dependent helicase [Criblamydia sequanensis CRIB-18]